MSWLLNQKNNLQKILLFLILLCIPFQLGKHFWPSFSIVQGQQIDYLSPTLYVTDVLISFLFITTIASRQLLVLRKGFFYFLATVLILSIGIFLSSSPLSGWFGLLKLIELVFFGWYVAKNTQGVKLFLPIVFVIDIVFESLLAIAQFILHRSVGGIFYFFGERMFSSSTPGIANASINGQLVLRPYGTFPHPNVLAGFLLISISFVLLYLLQHKQKLWVIAVACLGAGALFATLSRISIFLFVVSVFTVLIIRKSFRRLAFPAIFVFFLFVLLTPFVFDRFFFGDIIGQALQYREVLANIAFAMWREHPVFGVGINNFLILLPSFSESHQLVGFIQPVHNIYLLILSQTGIIGLFIFLFFLYKTFKRIFVTRTRDWFWQWSSLSLILILSIGFFDHYWLTLQQGQLLFALVLGTCWSKSMLQ